MEGDDLEKGLYENTLRIHRYFLFLLRSIPPGRAITANSFEERCTGIPRIRLLAWRVGTLMARFCGENRPWLQHHQENVGQFRRS